MCDLMREYLRLIDESVVRDGDERLPDDVSGRRVALVRYTRHAKVRRRRADL